MASEPVDLALWLAETLAEGFAESVETMSGERPTVASRTVEDGATDPEGALWWEQPFNLGPEASVLLGVPEASWLTLGKHILTSAGVESTEPAEARSTFLEISSQALSGLARALSSRLGKTVSCENGVEAPGPKPGAKKFEIDITLGAAGVILLRLEIAPGLLAAVTEAEPPARQADSAPSADSLPQRIQEKPVSSRAPNTLDLLMEVELPVSVSFGRADLPLKDVLKLTTGSIIELNRVLTEPVEVIVNNCVVARGEVVVIDGNYGVRIQEIISREKRLRTLR